ncbi:Os07g0543750 [Oryza sativa Japonica Group]|uniref:Os07g0543750 protein n=1 Tax=Oryza sativa subsp. japonica TaxID=39947 RepID=Q6Z5B3_ORYSJ|nr:hypothetical protein DAI22_07g178200 [Oryza sativa Japonica Group]BAC83777.1 hypothetical protein [Oryza sativa Japonica Group]BAD30350.1 hypothetical protein [Oryza sativa Japonica Group]BAH93974.1 Os07g0543750 [Oryza sativa Japonica Group]|eukprot:NP_001175246.1 Os07g0543750 [Oryza sativa Japonica Group]
MPLLLPIAFVSSSFPLTAAASPSPHRHRVLLLPTSFVSFSSPSPSPSPLRERSRRRQIRRLGELGNGGPVLDPQRMSRRPVHRRRVRLPITRRFCSFYSCSVGVQPTNPSSYQRGRRRRAGKRRCSGNNGKQLPRGRLQRLGGDSEQQGTSSRSEGARS